jgi:hypothetical protein
MDTPAAHPRAGPVETVLLERERLAERVVERLRSEVPVYGKIAPADLLPGVNANIGRVLAAVEGTLSLAEEDLGAFADIGRLRATQGIPIEDLLYGLRLGVEETIDELTRVGRASEVPDATLLELVVDTHRISDGAMRAIAQGHREEEIARAGSERDRRTDLVRQLLYGALGQSAIRVQAEVYGLDTERSYHAIRARPSPELPAIDLERRLGIARGAGRPAGLGALLDGDLAGFIDRMPPRDIEAHVGIGPAVPLSHLDESFRLATRALETAIAFGLRGLHDLQGLGVRAAILTDREVGDELKRRYIDPLAAGDTSMALAETVERYIENGKRIEATARQLFVHANTLRYRLKRFEELTGCDLRDPGCVLEVWWALKRACLDDARVET